MDFARQTRPSRHTLHDMKEWKLEDLAALGSGLVYDPKTRTVRSSGNAAISYPADGNAGCAEVEGDSFWFRHRNDCILAAMNRFPPELPVFDIGGGNGFVAQHLQGHGTPCVLVEPGASGIALARERGVELLVETTLQDAHFSAGCMPAAGAFDVVEHQEDDVGFLGDIREALSPGGRLYMTVPAYSWIWSQADVDAGHFRRYTLPTLRNTLATAGFSVEFATYFFSFLPLPIWWFRTLPYRRQMHRGGPPTTDKIDPHTADQRSPGNLVDRLLKWELRRLSKGKGIPVGSSCMVVARAD